VQQKITASLLGDDFPAGTSDHGSAREDLLNAGGSYAAHIIASNTANTVLLTTSPQGRAGPSGESFRRVSRKWEQYDFYILDGKHRRTGPTRPAIHSRIRHSGLGAIYSCPVGKLCTAVGARIPAKQPRPLEPRPSQYPPCGPS